MNDSTEQRMKEWRPRQPSAGLRSRIFAPEPAAAKFAGPMFAFDLATWSRWFVPAVGCFLMATATLSHPEMHAMPTGESLAGQQLAFETASRHTAMNNVPVTNVEWTFGRASSSNNDSFVRTETNTLTK
jgi:hypothetical protein